MARERSSSSSAEIGKAPAPTAALTTMGDGAYSKGLAFERRGQLAEAATELTRAESDDLDHADLALYALGRLYQHRLGNAQGALTAFERYRSHYPQGALLPEVDLAILEVEVEAGDRKDALVESIRFLASHPASERTDEVRLLRGNLLRDSGECRTALGEYAQVKVPAFAEGALYGIARCQGKLGNRSAEREALEAYRTRYPAGAHRDEVAKELADEPTKQF
jgi:tetratricopeptide (TPR) repeat protein